MAVPDFYFPQFDFTSYQESHPSDPLPGNSLDNELFLIASSIAQIIQNLNLIQRSDGALANNSVGVDQLSTELDVGISPATLWATATQYQVRNYVFGPDGNLYKCLVAHVSNVFATDVANGDWFLMVNFASTASLRTENCFRNPFFDVIQRAGGTIGAGTTAYGPDGWIFAPVGAGLAWGGTVPGASVGPEGRFVSLSLACASGMTGLTMAQRIESLKAARLYGNGSKRVTVSLTFQNAAAAAIAPKLTVKHATAGFNDFSTMATDINAVVLQSVSNSAGSTTCAYTFNTVSGTNNGLEVTFDFGGGLNAASGGIFIDELTISVTPQYPVGVCTSPPFCVGRELAAETALCERYFKAFGGVTGIIGQGAATSATAAGFFLPFHVTMRAQPNAISVTTPGNFKITDMAGADVATVTSLGFGNASLDGVFLTATVAAGLTAGADYQLRCSTALNGNLLVKGAEL